MSENRQTTLPLKKKQSHRTIRSVQYRNLFKVKILKQQPNSRNLETIDFQIIKSNPKWRYTYKQRKMRIRDT